MPSNSARHIARSFCNKTSEKEGLGPPASSLINIDAELLGTFDLRQRAVNHTNWIRAEKDGTFWTREYGEHAVRLYAVSFDEKDEQCRTAAAPKSDLRQRNSDNRGLIGYGGGSPVAASYHRVPERNRRRRRHQARRSMIGGLVSSDMVRGYPFRSWSNHRRVNLNVE